MGLSLKQWRLAKEISQAEMASKCGVHRNTYAAWEENPDEISVGNAKIIAKALKESVDTIFLIAILQNVGMIKKGVREVVIALLVITLVVAISKWIVYRLSFMAVLLYYAECGQEIPDNSTIQKYQTKAALKLLGIREK